MIYKKFYSEAETGDIHSLKNINHRKTCLLLSGGPSVSKWKLIYEKLSYSNPDIKVAVIKDTLELVQDELNVDYHFLNQANQKKYKYLSHETKTFFTKEKNLPIIGSYDYIFEVDKDNSDILSISKNFEKYSINNSGNSRPIGPGIMYETVFYLLQYMGFKEIIIAGWDIANNRGFNEHFGDTKSFSKFYTRNNTANINPIILKIYRYIKYYLVAYLLFICGKKINKSVTYEGEAELVSSIANDFCQWMQSKGTQIKIYSESKWLKNFENKISINNNDVSGI